MGTHAFISYVRDNTDIVEKLNDELKNIGITTWIDRENISPGNYWKDAIGSAISNGAFFIACYSRELEQRDESFMHGELRLAVDRLRNMPRSRMWFIPIRLDDCEIPHHPISDHESLADIQTVDLFKDWNAGIASIIASMGLVKESTRLLKSNLHVAKTFDRARPERLREIFDQLFEECADHDSKEYYELLNHPEKSVRIFAKQEIIRVVPGSNEF